MVTLLVTIGYWLLVEFDHPLIINRINPALTVNSLWGEKLKT